MGQQVVRVGFGRNGGVGSSRNSVTPVSNSKSPWSINCNVAAAVNNLVIDAVSNLVARVFFTSHARLAWP